MSELLNGLLYKHGKVPPLTLALIAACVLISLYSNLGDSLAKLLPLLMSEYRGNSWSQLVEIQQGQYWRLLSPILVHFGVLHLLFNMMWLWDLGGAIESRWSSLELSVLVIAIGISSNLVQYLMQGALFGGMSGVVYGLLGYLFVLGRLRPDLGLQVPPQIMAFMMIWFALCWTGMLGGIANWAHTAGLAAGAAIGLLRSQIR
jgi:GlpG protein